METFVVRVWVPDRPGALGQVASRIGAVRGDVVGIDILERGAGRAIDELVVELPDASLVALLLAEIDQVDGVDVEDVRPAPAELADPRLDALETAALLVGAALGTRSCSTRWWPTPGATSAPNGRWSSTSTTGRCWRRTAHRRRRRGWWPSWPAAGRRPRSARGSAAPTTWPGPRWATPGWPCSSAARAGPSGPRERHQLAALCKIADST